MPTTWATSPISGTRSATSRPPSTPDSPTASTPRSRRAATSSRVDDAAQDRRRDLECLGVGDTEAALEAGRDAEPFQPFGDPLAAAVDDDDGAPAGDDRHLGEHLLLVGERRPAELEDEDLAHVVYSAFSITYCSVRSHPKASPLPAPRPRSSRTRISGASIEARTAARSSATGPPAGPS